MASDQTTVMRKSEVKFTMKDPAVNATTVTFFANVEFATPGSYFVEVLVDDVMKIRYPLTVFVVPPPNQQQPPQSGAGA
ncbi:MAG TPA: hypothetical protein VMZ27_03510 [Candidatus Saccharimonadales bacterium]|nr:hypothetical protein [Candidatus Saccharimonadales bacterium]